MIFKILTISPVTNYYYEKEEEKILLLKNYQEMTFSSFSIDSSFLLGVSNNQFHSIWVSPNTKFHYNLVSLTTAYWDFFTIFFNIFSK